MIVRDRKGRPRLVPAYKVTKYMNSVRAAIRRQLQEQHEDWQLIVEPVSVVLETYLYYRSDLPKSDIDNYYTTIQECLQNILILDDRQVDSFLVFRNKTNTRQGQYSRLYLWHSGENKINDYVEFLSYLENSHVRHRTGSSILSTASNTAEAHTIIDWF